MACFTRAYVLILKFWSCVFDSIRQNQSQKSHKKYNDKLYPLKFRIYFQIEEQPTKKYSLRKSRQLNIPPEAFESDSDKEEHVETIINDEVTVETVETCHEQENFVDPIAYEDSAFVDVSNRQVKIEPSTADDDAVDGIKQELLDSAQPNHVEEEAIPEALSDALQESIEDLMMGSIEAAFPGASALEKSLDEILAQQRAHEASMADQDS